MHVKIDGVPFVPLTLADMITKADKPEAAGVITAALLVVEANDGNDLDAIDRAMTQLKRAVKKFHKAAQ